MTNLYDIRPRDIEKLRELADLLIKKEKDIRIFKAIEETHELCAALLKFLSAKNPVEKGIAATRILKETCDTLVTLIMIEPLIRELTPAMTEITTVTITKAIYTLRGRL